MEDSFQELIKSGVVEKVNDLPAFIDENPEHSFLPHMGVFKTDRATTKCRIVFLSNLCEGNQKKPLTLSHNQVMHYGPCLSQKITTALLHLRVGEKLLCFDLKKAFLQIALSERLIGYSFYGITMYLREIFQL